jgi:hypothetical protein
MRFSITSSLIACFLFATISLSAIADSAPPKHNCAKPDHPGTLASEARMKGFQKEVNDYRDCINKFASDQKVFSENHMTAGNNAINEFNTFAKTEMNPKKEDEPAK